MTRIMQLALAGLCAGLLLIIAAELFHVGNQENFPSAIAGGSTTAGVNTLVPALDMEAMVDVILERPLFSPTRHPPDALVAADIEETSERAPPQLRGRLAGVMIRPGAREALFARAGQRPIAVKVGGEIDGWKIAAIEPDRVILSSDFGNQTLRPTNDPEVGRPPTHAPNTNLGPAQPGVAAASTAPALGNRGNRAARAGSTAMPNPMRNPLQFAARTNRPGRR